MKEEKRTEKQLNKLDLKVLVSQEGGKLSSLTFIIYINHSNYFV